MPINGMGNISSEQLMAMSLMSNGQLTNDSKSQETDQYNTLAFQLMLQNYMDQAKNTTSESVSSVVNNATQQGNATQNSSEGEASNLDGINSAAASNKISRAVQTYMAGQKLTDIPLILNNYYSSAGVQGIGNTSSALNSSSPEVSSKIYAAVRDASKKYGVDENLILAVIKQESDFDSTCTSGVGAAGLMQIMPSNYSHLGITDPYDVEQNVNGGTKLLKEYMDKYNGSIEMALMAYNGGPGTMSVRGVTSASDLYKMPLETQNYVPKVMGYYNNGI